MLMVAIEHTQWLNSAGMGWNAIPAPLVGVSQLHSRFPVR